MHIILYTLFCEYMYVPSMCFMTIIARIKTNLHCTVHVHVQMYILEWHGRAFQCIGFVFWWPSRQNVGSNPDQQRCLWPWKKLKNVIVSLHPRSQWVPVRAELVVVFDQLYMYMRRDGSNWAAYSPGSWDGFRNDLCAWWAGVIMLSAVIPCVRALYKNAFIIK